MASLVLIGKKLALACTRDEREVAKGIAGGDWDKGNMSVMYPKEYKVYRDIKAEFPNVSVAPDVQAWVNSVERARQYYRELKEGKHISLKTELSKKLYPYQMAGVNFMVKGKRIINADDMGLGKTFQTICACEEDGSKRVLIICPNSLKYNWENEIMRWAGKSATIISGTKVQKERAIETFEEGYLVANYEAVRLLPNLTNISWDTVVFDEAHRLKNRKTLQTKTCKGFAKDLDRRVYALTGTPMENRPDELWQILNILYPKQFGSYWRFVEQYCEIEEFSKDGNDIRKPKGCKNTRELYTMLEPVMIRRLKVDVLEDLPRKLRQNVYVKLGKTDRKIYDALERDMISELPSGDIVMTPSLLSNITRLRQVAISHQLLETEEGRTDKVAESSKIDALVDMISDSVDGHKIVVFTQFRSALDVVKKRLDSLDIKYLEISGVIKDSIRQSNVELFQNDSEHRVMLATIQTAGVGLTLTSADVCIFLDKHWNPMLNLQAEDRLYRIGQVNTVNVINIVAKDTIEEYIMKMLEDKEQLFGEVIEGKESKDDELLRKVLERMNKGGESK